MKTTLKVSLTVSVLHIKQNQSFQATKLSLCLVKTTLKVSLTVSVLHKNKNEHLKMGHSEKLRYDK